VAERLTKAERIRQRADYLRIQGSGRKLHTPSFICFGSFASFESAAAPAECPTRLGITVSRRVGGAVVRNRVKRLIREAYRRQKAAFGGGVELVVIARPEAAQITYAQVYAELHEVGRRLSKVGRRGAP
jgi:ribonuclease P protein component